MFLILIVLLFYHSKFTFSSSNISPQEAKSRKQFDEFLIKGGLEPIGGNYVIQSRSATRVRGVPESVLKGGNRRGKSK